MGASRVSSSLIFWEDVPCSRDAWQCAESLDSPPQASANSPARQGVKVPFLRVEHLVFHSSQSKANGQHGESEDEEACDSKHSSPGVKPAHRGRKGVSALRAPQGTFNPFSRSNPEWDRESNRAQERFPEVLISIGYCLYTRGQLTPKAKTSICPDLGRCPGATPEVSRQASTPLTVSHCSHLQSRRVEPCGRGTQLSTEAAAR